MITDPVASNPSGSPTAVPPRRTVICVGITTVFAGTITRAPLAEPPLISTVPPAGPMLDVTEVPHDAAKESRQSDTNRDAWRLLDDAGMKFLVKAREP